MSQIITREFPLEKPEQLQNIIGNQDKFLSILEEGLGVKIDQLQLISRNTPKLTIAYDGDSAGQSATWRAIEEIKNFPHLQLEIVTIPNQKDRS